MQLELHVTQQIADLLQQIRQCPAVQQDAKTLAEELKGATHIPWSQLRDLAGHLQTGQPGLKIDLYATCHGSSLALPAPPARQQSPELQQRLAKLQEALQERQYATMVQDITQEERAAAALREGGLRMFKDQIGFGIHVMVMMGTFYALGHVAGKALSPKRSVHAACGLLGLIAALLLETLLLVIRSSSQNVPRRTQSQGRMSQQQVTKPSVNNNTPVAAGKRSNNLRQRPARQT